MNGNHLLEFRLMKAHQERLVAEGERHRLARLATPGTAGLALRFAATRPLRMVAARLGRSLVAIGRRLQALDSCTSLHH